MTRRDLALLLLLLLLAILFLAVWFGFVGFPVF